ncbi:MAG: type II toxin-antitoxin system RelE/ParE family toxin [Cyanophyceae cyanobacterium]
MLDTTYGISMGKEREVVWLKAEIKTPPFSPDARITAGFLLRKLQQGENLSLPESRPMPIVGGKCHELRIHDDDASCEWRIIYRIDDDSIVIANVFKKKTQKTPQNEILLSQYRLKTYDEILGGS